MYSTKEAVQNVRSPANRMGPKCIESIKSIILTRPGDKIPPKLE